MFAGVTESERQQPQERASTSVVIDPCSLQAFDVPTGHVKVIWDLRVEPGALGGTPLSTTRQFTTDKAASARLLGAWEIVGMFAESLSQRTLTAIKRYAEDCDDFGQPASPHSIGALPASLQNTRRAAWIGDKR